MFIDFIEQLCSDPMRGAVPQASPPLLYNEGLGHSHGASPTALIQLPGLESAALSFAGLPSIVRPSPLWQKRKPPAAEDPQQSQTPSQVLLSSVTAALAVSHNPQEAITTHALLSSSMNQDEEYLLHEWSLSRCAGLRQQCGLHLPVRPRG